MRRKKPIIKISTHSIVSRLRLLCQPRDMHVKLHQNHVNLCHKVLNDASGRTKYTIARYRYNTIKSCIAKNRSYLSRFLHDPVLDEYDDPMLIVCDTDRSCYVTDENFVVFPIYMISIVRTKYKHLLNSTSTLDDIFRVLYYLDKEYYQIEFADDSTRQKYQKFKSNVPALQHPIAKMVDGKLVISNCFHNQITSVQKCLTQ